MLIQTCSLLLFLSALALGCIHLGTLPFWVDESIAALPAAVILKRGAPFSPFDLDYMPWQLIYGIWDPATPLYRYALALFTAVLGFSETTVRLFSLLCGGLTAWPLFHLVKKAYDKQTAWLSVATFAAAPTFWEFAREGRHFTFLQLLTTATILSLVLRINDSPQRLARHWPALICACLLTQVMGYLILPVALVLLFACKSPRVLADLWQSRWNRVAVVVFVGIFVVFFKALAFFHPVDCNSRNVGCHPGSAYYLLNLIVFASGFSDRLETSPMLGLSLGLPLAVSGIFLTAQKIFAAYQRLWAFAFAWLVLTIIALAFIANALQLPQSIIVSTLITVLTTILWLANKHKPLHTAATAITLWLFIPLVLLSLNELKFPRYVFIWSWPALAVGIAIGIARFAGLFLRWRLMQLVAMALLLAVALGLQWLPATASTKAGWSLATVQYIHNRLLNIEDDDWEHLRLRANYLANRIKPQDIVVTSFDDAGLGYYLKRFVYGMIRGDRSDEQLLALLAEAEQKNGVVWFDDTLPEFDFCLTAGAQAQAIACRDKYPKFYAACSLSHPSYNPRCIPLRFGPPCRGTHTGVSNCNQQPPPYIEPCTQPNVCSTNF